VGRAGKIRIVSNVGLAGINPVRASHHRVQKPQFPNPSRLTFPAAGVGWLASDREGYHDEP